ncbi:MAG: glycosyltransferase family 39 protein [Anaerolineales bacterium]|nr:glycosyltransferase family 39 protein [Anaerolineales bacterium]
MEPTPASASWFDKPVMGRHSIRWEQLLWIVLIAAAVVSRFAMLEPRVISHDEGQHVQMAWALYRGEGYTPTPMTHGPFQIIAVAFSYFLFGASDFSSRIPAALFGAAAVALMYCFRRWLGRTGALAAGALMLISPYMLYYSRYVRNEAFVVVWGLLMFLAVGRYLETRAPRWLWLLAAATALHYATKETAYIYSGLAIVFLFGLLQVQLLLHHWADSGRRSRYFTLATLAVLLAAGAVVLIVRGRADLIEAALQSGAVADPEQMTHTEIWISHPMVIAGVVLFLMAVAAWLVSLWALIKEFGLDALREKFPAVDLLVVLSTTLLPQLAALPMALFNLNPFDGNPYDKINRAEYILPVLVIVLIMAALAAVIGLMWNKKLWAAYAGIFFGIYILLFSVCLTNFSGVVMGLVAAVNYWMAQQEVQRGAQPWYYYLLIQIPVYEYLPALLALSAPGVALWLRRKPAPEADSPDPGEGAGRAPGPVIASLMGSPVIWMIGYWCVTAFVAFTFAGEKMPWLTVHITFPLILIGGWVVGRLAERVDWQSVLASPRWIGLLVVPGMLVAAALAAGMWMGGGTRPFSGSDLDSLSVTGNFVFCALVAAAGAVFLWRLWRDLQPEIITRIFFLGAILVLGICTLRTAWRSSYLLYDEATEFLVYAHGAGGVKTAIAQIEEISRKTQDDLDLVVPYDQRSGWLVYWYLREYPNAYNYIDTMGQSMVDAPAVIVADHYWQQADRLLADTHYSFTYMRMWWPMMDYFDLTWERVWNAASDPAYRSALWQIWFNRDYTEYGRVTGRDFSLSNWPSGERMRLYVRKDLAVTVWQYGSEAFTPPVEIDPYANSVRTLHADILWGQAGPEPGSLQRPRAIAAAPDGSVYVADTGNHRIQHFDPQGNLLHVWGSFSGPDAALAPEGTFNEPWGVAVDSEGSVYVADTWNFRIQKFSPDGAFLAVWGSYTHEGEGFQFYGPRAIAVDSRDRVFVADTGNKRITVYDSDGGYLMPIGQPGFDYGQFDEPVGLGFGPDGRLYVADTWNRRIQVFEEVRGEYIYLMEWVIDGWEGQSTDTKPYLAVSEDGRVWVTDPGNARVLVFDADGNFLFTFGLFGDDAASFALPTGIAVGRDGRIFVTDTDNNRIMLFSGL